MLGERPNQVDRQRDDVDVGAAELLDVASTPGAITEAGLRNNVNVGIQYISSWLRGNGAAGDLRADGGRGHGRDLALAGVAVDPPRAHARATARRSPPELVRRLEGEELERIRAEIGDDEWFEREGRPEESRELFEQVALADELAEFLTIPAYEQLD